MICYVNFLIKSGCIVSDIYTYIIESQLLIWFCLIEICFIYVGNEDRQKSEGTLAVGPTGELQALKRRVIDIIDRIIPGVLEESIW